MWIDIEFFCRRCFGISLSPRHNPEGQCCTSLHWSWEEFADLAEGHSVAQTQSCYDPKACECPGYSLPVEFQVRTPKHLQDMSAYKFQDLEHTMSKTELIFTSSWSRVVLSYKFPILRKKIVLLSTYIEVCKSPWIPNSLFCTYKLPNPTGLWLLLYTHASGNTFSLSWHHTQLARSRPLLWVPSSLCPTLPCGTHRCHCGMSLSCFYLPAFVSIWACAHEDRYTIQYQLSWWPSNLP